MANPMPRFLKEQLHSCGLLRMTDDALIAEMKSSVHHERQVTLKVLLVLVEVERRKLHLDRYSSLFAYCTDCLGYSRAASWRRIASARSLSLHPDVLPMLVDGRLNLTTLSTLSRVMTPGNASELLARASGASQREVERMTGDFGAPSRPLDRIKPVRSRRPEGLAEDARDARDRASSSGKEGSTGRNGSGVSDLPDTSSEPTNSAAGDKPAADRVDETSDSVARSNGTRSDCVSETGQTKSAENAHGDRRGLQADASDSHSTDPTANHFQADDSRESMDPNLKADPGSDGGEQLVEQLYDITFRADSRFVEKLQRMKDLLPREASSSSLVTVFDRAIESFLDAHDPERRAARRTVRRRARSNAPTEDQRSSVAANDTGGSTRQPAFSEPSQQRLHRNPSAYEAPQGRALRHRRTRRSIAQWVRDAVFLRDGKRCSHVGAEGRCPETRCLEIDHADPLAKGGNNEIANLRAYCRAHNQRAADRAFGREFMDRFRTRAPASGAAV